MIQDLTIKLIEEAGVDSLSDRYTAGLIAGYRDVLSLKLGDDE